MKMIRYLTPLRFLSSLCVWLIPVVGKCLGPNHHILWKLPNARQALPPTGELLPTNLRIEHWIPSQLGVLAHPTCACLLLTAAVMVSMREFILGSLFW